MGGGGSCWEVRLLRYSGVWADAVLSVQMAGSCGTERLIVCLWPAVVQSVWGLHSRSCFQVAVQTEGEELCRCRACYAWVAGPYPGKCLYLFTNTYCIAQVVIHSLAAYQGTGVVNVHNADMALY
jgi:hypothetical protein